MKRTELKQIIREELQSMNGINLAIIGSRTFNNYSYAKEQILNIIQKNKLSITKIISGGAHGADKIAEIFADKFNIPVEIITPDWSMGRHAGIVRNTDIIKKSDYVIAFWDGESKGTLDSINKAKRLNKKLFVIKISPRVVNKQVELNEGIRLNDDGSYFFDFNEDKKDDIIKLKYNNNYIVKKKSNGLISYFSYKTNKKIDKDIRNKLLKYIKNNLKGTNDYDILINKSVLGLFNNPNIEVRDADLILIPESSSGINLDLVDKIKSKIPNALFLKDSLLKNDPQNITVDNELLQKKKYKPETIFEVKKMIKKATVNGVFKMKKVNPRFRRYILNFLKLDNTNRILLNRLVNGKVIVVDDIVTEGSTFREANRLIENYAPKEIILFSLVG